MNRSWRYFAPQKNYENYEFEKGLLWDGPVRNEEIVTDDYNERDDLDEDFIPDAALYID